MREAHGTQNTMGQVRRNKVQATYKQSLVEQRSLVEQIDLISAAEIRRVKLPLKIPADIAVKPEGGKSVFYGGGIKLLPARDNIEADSKDDEERMSLSWAATGEHEAVTQ